MRESIANNMHCFDLVLDLEPRVPMFQTNGVACFDPSDVTGQACSDNRPQLHSSHRVKGEPRSGVEASNDEAVYIRNRP